MQVMKRDAGIPEMKNFLGCSGRPVSNTEMMEFWKSLGETTYVYTWENAKGEKFSETWESEKDFFKQGIAKIIDEEAEKARLASNLTSV